MLHCHSLPPLRALLALSIAASSAAAQGLLVQYGEVVLAAGDQAPGLPAGITANASGNTNPFLASPVMDQNGTVLFRSRLFDAGGIGGITSSNDRAYFFGRANGDLAMVVRADDPAPGCGGATFRSSSTTSGSSGLQVNFRISPFGEILLFPTSIYDAVNPANTPATSNTALFWGPVGGILKVARMGEEVPFFGVGSGILWGNVAPQRYQMGLNSAGTMLFANVMTGNVTASTDAVLVTGQPNALTIVSREGDVLPGGEVVVTVATGNALTNVFGLNEAGMVLHQLGFSNTSGTATAGNDRALSIWIAGVENIIAREGDPAPGEPAGTLFANSSSTWTADGVSQFTQGGRTTLNAAIYDPANPASTPLSSDRVLYYGGLGGWTKILRESEPTGLPNAELFGVVGNSGIACNDAGQVAYVTSLIGGTVPVTGNNESSLWLAQAGVSNTMLAREGELVVADGFTGTWYFDQISQGSSTPRLNERGHILWSTGVRDGATIVGSSSYKTVDLCWTPKIGWQCVRDGTEAFTTSLGTSTTFLISNDGNTLSSDGAGNSWFNNQGDWVGEIYFETATVKGAMVRGHVGTMHCRPSSVPITGGVPHTMDILCGPTLGLQFYLVLASNAGTRPGFPNPLNFALNVPLNLGGSPDWVQLSFDLANSVVWGNSLSLTDAQGKATATFTMPAGYPMFQGTTLHHAAALFDFTLLGTHVTEPSAVKIY